MAQSTCVKCGNTNFQVVEKDFLSGTDYKWNFVQCSSCGGVVGVLDYYTHTGIVKSLEQIKQALRLK